MFCSFCLLRDNYSDASKGCSFLRGSLTSPSTRSLWQDDRCRALDNLLECDNKHPTAAVCSIGGEKGCCPSDINGNVIMTHWDDGAEPCSLSSGETSAATYTKWQDDRCRALDNLVECDDKHQTAAVCSIGGEKGCCPSDITGNVIMTHWDDGAEPCRLSPTAVPTASPTPAPTLERGECEDDANYLYKGYEGRNCSVWVAEQGNNCLKIDPVTDKKVQFFCPSKCKDKCKDKPTEMAVLITAASP